MAAKKRITQKVIKAITITVISFLLLITYLNYMLSIPCKTDNPTENTGSKTQLATLQSDIKSEMDYSPNIEGKSQLNLEQFGIKADGTDEAFLLQEALDHARDNFVENVVFPSDKTIVVGSVITVHQGLNLVGNGCIIKLADNHPDRGGFIRLKEYTQTRQLKIDGNKENGNTGTKGVRLYSNSLFEENEVYNVSSHSIYTYKGDNISVLKNIIHDSDNYGVFTNGEPEDYAGNITIAENTIYNCKDAGIRIRCCANSLVTQNTITLPDGVTADGICLYGASGPNSGIDITNNTVKKEGSSDYSTGINSMDQYGQQINISGNRIDGVYRGITIHFPGANVTGNEINNCDWTGIWLISDDAVVENNILTEAGMIINTNRPDYNPSRNIIKGNIINVGNQYWRAMNTGIFIWYTTTGNVIEGNEIRVADYAVRITDEFGQSTGTIVQNNFLYSKTGYIDDRGNSTDIANNLETPLTTPLLQETFTQKNKIIPINPYDLIKEILNK